MSEKRVKRNRKKNQRVRGEGDLLMSKLASPDPDVRDEARNRCVVDGRVFLGQTAHTENQRILSFHASLGSKLIGRCLCCESGKLATFAVFVPGQPRAPPVNPVQPVVLSQKPCREVC